MLEQEIKRIWETDADHYDKSGRKNLPPKGIFIIILLIQQFIAQLALHNLLRRDLKLFSCMRIAAGSGSSLAHLTISRGGFKIMLGVSKCKNMSQIYGFLPLPSDPYFDSKTALTQ
jgi:hypothetical protein